MNAKRKDVWFISDWHLYHENILKFIDYNGNRVREFDNIAQIHDYMITKHNELVKPQDKVFMLGDVCFGSQENLRLVPKFNGEKHMIIGNHDRFQMSEYEKFFTMTYSGRKIGDIILSHYPLHPSVLGKAKLNVHGHTHGLNVCVDTEFKVLDKRYYNVSVENVKYTPVHIDTLTDYIRIYL